MFWSNANSISNTIWATLESIVIIGTPIFFILKGQRKLDKRLDRIEYALFNDGKTGLINKVDAHREPKLHQNGYSSPQSAKRGLK